MSVGYLGEEPIRVSVPEAPLIDRGCVSLLLSHSFHGASGRLGKLRLASVLIKVWPNMDVRIKSRSPF